MSDGPLPVYQVRGVTALPDMGAAWNDPAWAIAEMASVTHFRPESSAHNPRARVRLLHGPGGLRGIFHVDDQFVRSTRIGFQSQVFRDSCVEFFMKPKADRGYFNLEMNAGGSHLCYYVEDHTRTPDGFVKYSKLTPDEGAQFKIRSTLPATVDPEIATPLAWELNFYVPLAVLEKYAGPLGALSGQEWRGNFYKCADELSHPHWVSWSPVDEFNFHLPRCFGLLRFE